MPHELLTSASPGQIGSPRLQHGGAGADRVHAFERLLRYVELRLSDEQFTRFRARLTELAPTTEDMVMRYSERLIAEGEAKGRLEGRLEGRLDAQRDILRTLLTSKFGALEPTILERIDTAEPHDLDAWLARIVLVADLDAVFRDPH